MQKRLLIIRNPESPLLDYLDLRRENQEIFLIQNALYSGKLREGDVKMLDEDARARKIEAGGKSADYDALLDAVFTNDLVICI
ncbi:MAG: hypothetical protein ACE5EN_08035 [Nitrospinota bacterium]